MQWVAAALPLTIAAACTAAFFLAGRERKDAPTSATPPSGGPPNRETPASEPESFFPMEELQEQPTLQIVPEWRRATTSPSAARRFSLPIREVAAPPTSGTPSLADVSMTTVSPRADLAEPGLSSQPPIWLSHWASNSQATWLSGSDTAQLQRVSTEAPRAIAGGPASSVWWAPGHASLSRSSATAYSNGRSSHRAPNADYLPPWARTGN